MALFYLAIIVSFFVLSSISRGSFNSECFLWCVFIHLLVPSSSCGFVLDSISECFSVLSVLFWGSPHVTDCQGDFTHNRKTGSKQAQDPPGSLHTIVSPVE